MQLQSTSSSGAAGSVTGGAASSALLKSISFLSKSQKPKVFQPKIIHMDDTQPTFINGSDSMLSVNEGLPPALLIQSHHSDNKGGSSYLMDQSLNRQFPSPSSSSDVAVKNAPSVGAIPKPAVAAGPVKDPPAF